MTLDPLRLGLEATRLAFRVTEGALKLPFRIAGALLGGRGAEPVDGASHGVPGTSNETGRGARHPQSGDTPSPAAPPAPSLAPDPVASRVEEPALEPEEPIHIDDEPELVGEFSEPGAEEGVGAEIHVDEPWDGYRRMKVADIQERVAVADTAQLAVVQLFESMHRNRKSIIQAVERRNRALANEQNARTNGR